MKYYYTQTVVYTTVIEADSEEAADALVAVLDLTDPSVTADATDWEEDGYED